MSDYARVRNSDEKVMEIRDHPDGHVDTLKHKFGPSHAERWIPIEIKPDETPSATQKLIRVETVMVTKVTYQQKAVALSSDEQKRQDATAEGAEHVTAMKTLPTAEQSRKAMQWLLSQAGATE